MNEDRRAAQRRVGASTENLISVAELLKRREDWKYAALKEALEGQGRKHEFEYAIEDRVFDLALLDEKVLVEFDGPYHRSVKQIERDGEKGQLAKRHGFKVVHRQVDPATVIHPSTLKGL